MTDLRSLLSHVYWMGGSPCSGKSSIAQALARRHDFHYYECDQAFYRHAALITPVDQPVFYRVTHYSSEELWMRPVAEQIADELEIYREQFPWIVADLLALPRDRPILVEGAAALPEQVAPLLASPRRGIWVIPTQAFQLEHYARREWAKAVVADCSDPALAFQNWMRRDMGFALEVRRQAEQRGLRVLVVDGARSIAENTALVGEHLGLVG